MAKVWDGQRTDYVYDNADRLQFYVRHDGSVVVYDWDANGNMIARAERFLKSNKKYLYFDKYFGSNFLSIKIAEKRHILDTFELCNKAVHSKPNHWCKTLCRPVLVLWVANW